MIAKNLGTPEDAAAADVQAYATTYLWSTRTRAPASKYPRKVWRSGQGKRWTLLPLGSFAGWRCRLGIHHRSARIMAANYSDILGDPDNVKLSLSNAPRDLSHTLASISNDLYGTSTANGGGGGGGGGAAPAGWKLTEYRTAINRNTDNIELIAWDVDDLNGDGYGHGLHHG